MAGNIRIPLIFGIASPRAKLGAATARAPDQETRNVTRKYETTG